MADPQQQKGDQQQKGGQVSRVFALVGEHNPTEFAEWQRTHDVSAETMKKLYSGNAPDVANAMRIGGFYSGARVVLDIVAKRLVDDGELTDAAKADLETVLQKTGEKVAEAEKKKKAVGEKKTTKEGKEIHSIGDFIGSISDKEWRNTALARLTLFANSLTPEQRKKFNEGLKDGDQKNKLLLIARIDDNNQQKAIAELHGWI